MCKLGIYMCVCVCACGYTCVCVCAYTCVCVCVRVCVAQGISHKPHLERNPPALQVAPTGVSSCLHVDVANTNRVLVDKLAFVPDCSTLRSTTGSPTLRWLCAIQRHRLLSSILVKLP